MRFAHTRFRRTLRGAHAVRARKWDRAKSERASGICLAERVQRAARIARQEVADERGQRVGAQAEVTARHDRLEAPLPLRVGPNQKHLPPPPPPLRARAAGRTSARTCLAKHGRTARHSSRASPTNMFALPLGARLMTARATLELRLGALAVATLADTGRPLGVFTVQRAQSGGSGGGRAD